MTSLDQFGLIPSHPGKTGNRGNADSKPTKSAQKRTYFKGATPGTLEHFRALYMTDGINALIHEVREQFSGSDEDTIKTLVRTILYGAKDGQPRTKPLPPDPHDLTHNTDLYRFMDRIYKRWTDKQQKERKHAEDN